MTKQRRFPTDEEVDTFIASHFCAPEDMPKLAGTSYADQSKAASEESGQFLSQVGQYGTAAGDLRFYVRAGDDADDPLGEHIMRNGVRAYLAAASVGIKSLCPHTKQIRPMMLWCDPPCVFCSDCLGKPEARITEQMQSIGFLYNNVCDICGAAAEMLSPTTLGMAHLQVSCHSCRQCKDANERMAIENVDTVVPVGRNMACPCGSGKKFKYCCLDRKDSLSDD